MAFGSGLRGVAGSRPYLCPRKARGKSGRAAVNRVVRAAGIPIYFHPGFCFGAAGEPDRCRYWNGHAARLVPFALRGHCPRTSVGTFRGGSWQEGCCWGRSYPIPFHGPLGWRRCAVPRYCTPTSCRSGFGFEDRNMPSSSDWVAIFPSPSGRPAVPDKSLWHGIASSVGAGRERRSRAFRHWLWPAALFDGPGKARDFEE